MMTTAAEYSAAPRKRTIAPAITAIPLRVANINSYVVKGIQRLGGSAMMLAALGLWLIPGSSMESDVVVMKLLLSFSAALAGLGLLQASVMEPDIAVEIDLIRREVRVVRQVRGEPKKVMSSTYFSELGGAEIDGSMVRIWDRSGMLLAEAMPMDRKAFGSLVAGLRDEGKLL